MSLVKGVPRGVWIGVGCLGAIGAIVLGTAGFFFWGMQTLYDAGQSMADPVERLEKTLKVIHADELPEGYYAVMAFSIPFFDYDYADLSNKPLDADGRPPDFGEQNFFSLLASTMKSCATSWRTAKRAT